MSRDLVDLIERAASRVLSHSRAATRGAWLAQPAASPSGVMAVEPERGVYVFTGAGAVPPPERLANPRYAALMHPRFGQVLGRWLQDAAALERRYRAENPDPDNMPDPGDEAYVAGVFAAVLLREDPADYGLTLGTWKDADA